MQQEALLYNMRFISNFFTFVNIKHFEVYKSILPVLIAFPLVNDSFVALCNVKENKSKYFLHSLKRKFYDKRKEDRDNKEDPE